MSEDLLDWFPVKIQSIDGQNFILGPDGRRILCGDDPWEAAKGLARKWDPWTGKTVLVDIPCICGSRKIGVPDFSPGHSDWCYHTPKVLKPTKS